MHVVIFELSLKDGRKPAYLDIAADLAPLLQDVDGFLSVERFQSLSSPEKLLSLSFWRDEKAVTDWRNLQNHRQAQQAGRGDIFADYRLTVASVARQYGMEDRGEVPGDSLAHQQSD